MLVCPLFQKVGGRGKGGQQGDCPVSCIRYPDIIHAILFFLVKNDASSLPLSLVYIIEFCFMASKVVKKRHVLNNRSK